MAEADQLRKQNNALRQQLEQSEAEKRRLQSKLMGPSPAGSKQRDLLVQLQTEAAVLRQKLRTIASERDAALVSKAVLQEQVAQLMEPAAEAEEGRRAAAQAAMLRAQLATLCRSVGAGEAADPEGPLGPSLERSEQQLAALCLWITEAQQQLSLMSTQSEEATATQQQVQEQLQQQQQPQQPPPQRQQAPAEPVAVSTPARAGGAPSWGPAGPVLGDGRLDARSTSTLIWGGDGVAAIPFASPSSSPSGAGRSRQADADAAPDQGAVAGAGFGDGGSDGRDRKSVV